MYITYLGDVFMRARNGKSYHRYLMWEIENKCFVNSCPFVILEYSLSIWKPIVLLFLLGNFLSLMILNADRMIVGLRFGSYV